MAINDWYPYRIVLTKNVKQALVPVAGAKVTPYIHGTGIQKDLMQDANGTVPLEKPVITDENGEAAFYIRAGRVRFDVELDAISYRQIEDVICDCSKIEELEMLSGIRRYDIDVSLLDAGAEKVVPALIKKGWQVYGITSIVIEEVVGYNISGWDLGLQESVDRDSWGKDISPVAGTVTDPGFFKVKSPLNFSHDTDVIIRPSTDGSLLQDGYVRLTVWYLTFTSV